MTRSIASAVLLWTMLTAPAMAQSSGGAPIAEPGEATLLAIGVVGLIVGRRAARRKD